MDQCKVGWQRGKLRPHKAAPEQLRFYPHANNAVPIADSLFQAAGYCDIIIYQWYSDIELAYRFRISSGGSRARPIQAGILGAVWPQHRETRLGSRPYMNPTDQAPSQRRWISTLFTG